uniref:Uncharacterized protein n=1 Tax=Oryza nivara TaxID=4536 RepID=A0A0E0GFS6_ORYNI
MPSAPLILWIQGPKKIANILVIPDARGAAPNLSKDFETLRNTDARRWTKGICPWIAIVAEIDGWDLGVIWSQAAGGSRIESDYESESEYKNSFLHYLLVSPPGAGDGDDEEEYSHGLPSTRRKEVNSCISDSAFCALTSAMDAWKSM